MTTPQTPLVSVVITTYNRAEMICESLDSVLEQDFDSYARIMVAFRRSFKIPMNGIN